MHQDQRSLLWGGGLSLVLHGLVAGAIFFVPIRASLSDTLFSAEVELAVAPDEVPAEPTAEPDVAPAETPDTEAAVPAEARAAPARSRPPPMMGAIVATEAAALPGLAPGPPVEVPSIGPETDVMTPEERDRERARIAMVLSAERYARDSVIRGDPGPSRRGAAAGGGDAAGGLGPSTPMLTEAEAEAAHSGHLAAAAASRPWLSHTPIVPREQSDGSWVYAGPLFTARIAPDGAVSFSDRDAVSYDLGTGAGGFDLTDMVMGGAGADPYAAERERFMEETEELRVRLEDAARAGDMERAVRRARVRIASLWSDEDRSAEARRRALFRVWDDCDDGEEGRAVRDAVVAFVRENLACGSANGFTPGELAALNATRESTELFDPC